MNPFHTMHEPLAQPRTRCNKTLAAALLLTALAFTTNLQAAPITYTGFTVTSGKLGSWEFKNAHVYLHLKSDTANVQNIVVNLPCLDPTAPPNCVLPPPAAIVLNATGKAWVTIISDGKRVRAEFAPNQILVSLDQGDAPFVPGNARGVGFGSFSANGVEPAYPLGIEDGTAKVSFRGTPGPDISVLLSANATDLKHDIGFSGRAWVCVGFNPGDLNNGDCKAPTPLKTDKGDFYLFQPYRALQSDGSYSDPLNGGWFSAVKGEPIESDE